MIDIRREIRLRFDARLTKELIQAQFCHSFLRHLAENGSDHPIKLDLRSQYRKNTRKRHEKMSFSGLSLRLEA